MCIQRWGICRIGDRWGNNAYLKGITEWCNKASDPRHYPTIMADPEWEACHYCRVYVEEIPAYEKLEDVLGDSPMDLWQRIERDRTARREVKGATPTAPNYQPRASQGKGKEVETDSAGSSKKWTEPSPPPKYILDDWRKRMTQLGYSAKYPPSAPEHLGGSPPSDRTCLQWKEEARSWVDSEKGSSGSGKKEVHGDSKKISGRSSGSAKKTSW